MTVVFVQIKRYSFVKHVDSIHLMFYSCITCVTEDYGSPAVSEFSNITFQNNLHNFYRFCDLLQICNRRFLQLVYTIIGLFHLVRVHLSTSAVSTSAISTSAVSTSPLFSNFFI